MAFIRKRGNTYYLVHNVRKGDRVRQLHLASLGHRPRLSDEVIRGVMSKHPFVQVNWKGLREKASREPIKPFEENDLRDLVTAIRNLHLDIADLHLPVLEMARNRELAPQVISELKLLRSSLEVKLNQLRRGRSMPLRV
jgi:hypothetical protein